MEPAATGASIGELRISPLLSAHDWELWRLSRVQSIIGGAIETQKKSSAVASACRPDQGLYEARAPHF
jgi:hypothetical protein